MSRLCDVSRTARCTTALARRRKRWRFSRLFAAGVEPPVDDLHRVAFQPACFTRICLDETAHLPLGVAARRHARDEFGVLLLGLAVLLRTEGDDRKQVLNLREHPLLDDLAEFLVAGPGRVLAAVLRARAQRI